MRKCFCIFNIKKRKCKELIAASHTNPTARKNKQAKEDTKKQTLRPMCKDNQWKRWQEINPPKNSTIKMLPITL